jgi:hypothetical protein
MCWICTIILQFTGYQHRRPEAINIKRAGTNADSLLINMACRYANSRVSAHPPRFAANARYNLQASAHHSGTASSAASPWPILGMHHFFRFLNQTQLCFLACCLLPFPIWTSFEDSLFMSKELGYINRQDYIIFIEVGLFLETGLYARLAQVVTLETDVLVSYVPA